MKELLEKYRAATSERERERLRNEIVLANVGLVRRIVRRHYRVDGDEVDDMVQTGTLGIMRAVESYDPAKGTWSNYAAWWIRHFCSTCRDTLTLVRSPRATTMPASAVATATKIRALEGREPTPEELGVEAQEVDGWRLKPTFASFDATADGEDDSRTLHDTLGDDAPDSEREPDVFANARLRAALDQISPRNRRILLDLVLGYTQEEVAGRAGLTRSGMRRVLSRLQEHFPDLAAVLG